MILTRPDPISIHKVRAHSGVAGNEAADKLAKDAHGSNVTEANTFKLTGKPNTPTNWIYYDSTATGKPDTSSPAHERRPVASLNDHLKSILDFHHASQRLSLAKNGVMLKTKTLLTDDGGIDTQATRAIWNNSLTAWDLRIAVAIRANRLWTSVRSALVHKKKRCLGNEAIQATTCLLCKSENDDADHALNKCNHAAVSRKIKLRHDDAVQMILTAIQIFSRSLHFRHFDTPNIKTPARTKPAQPQPRKFPNGVLPKPKQTSLPDITLINIPSTRLATFLRHGGTIPRQVRQQHTVDIIEVKYTYDLLVHARTQDAIDQHAQLRDNLLAYGWGTVRIHPFIIGSAGTIRQDCHHVLSVCGITEEAAQDALLRKIAIFSAKRTADIVKTRLSHKDTPASQYAANTGPPPNTDDSPPPTPRDPQPDMRDGSHDSSSDDAVSNPTDIQTLADTAAADLPPMHTPSHDAPRRGLRKRTPSRRRQEMTPCTRRRLFGPDTPEHFINCTSGTTLELPRTSEMHDEPAIKGTSTQCHLPLDPPGPAITPALPPTDGRDSQPSEITARPSSSQSFDDSLGLPSAHHGPHRKRKQASTERRSRHTSRKRCRGVPSSHQITDPRGPLPQRKRLASHMTLSPDPPEKRHRGRTTVPLGPEQAAGTPFDRGP